MKLFFIKDTLKKASGIIIIITGVLFLFVGLFAVVSGYQKGNKEDINIGYLMSGFSLVFIIPGAGIYISGVKLSRLEENLKQLATLIKTYRRISLTEVAKKFSMPEAEAEQLLNRAIELDLIKGNMDRTTGEFFVSESLGEMKKVSFCPNCGTSLSQVIYHGETGKCPSCGSLLN